MNNKEAEMILDRVANSEAVALLAKVSAATALVTHGAPLALDVAVVGSIDALRSMWTKRQTELTVNVVAELEALKIDVQKLIAENEHFATVFTMAIREAVATHEQEKLEALRNAVVNTATKLDLSQEKELLYLNTLSRLTASHLRILRMLDQYRLEDVAKHCDGTKLLLRIYLFDEPYSIQPPHKVLPDVVPDLVSLCLLDRGVHTFSDSNGYGVEMEHGEWSDRDSISSYVWRFTTFYGRELVAFFSRTLEATAQSPAPQPRPSPTTRPHSAR